MDNLHPAATTDNIDIVVSVSAEESVIVVQLEAIRMAMEEIKDEPESTEVDEVMEI